MDYQLVVVRGRASAEAIKLGDGVTTVGRHDECQLRIKSSQVSRKHCELFEKKGMLLVKDLGSSNGTYVNGKRVLDQRVLEAGDELTIGQVKLKVTKLGEAAPAPAPAPAGGKPADTAVVAASAAAAAAAAAPEDDDDFDIEFDENLDSPDTLDLTETSPKPAAAKQPEPPTVPKAAAEKKPAPEPEPVPETHTADDAVADFLLDINFDEEE